MASHVMRTASAGGGVPRAVKPKPPYAPSGCASSLKVAGPALPAYGIHTACAWATLESWPREARGVWGVDALPLAPHNVCITTCNTR
eukprot:106728-Prymnesium_polylepis.2